MRYTSLVLSLFLVCAPAALAQTGTPYGGPNGQRGGARQGMRGVSGDISTVQGNTLTVKNMRGTDTKVTITDQTVINRMPAGFMGGMRQQQPPAAGPSLKTTDLKVGNRVMVMGPRNADGTVTAERIMVLPPMVRGTIATVDQKSITVRDQAGKTTALKITDATKYMKGRQAATAADFKAGDPVMVQYDGDRAVLVQSGFAPGGGRGGAGRGGAGRGGWQGGQPGGPGQ